MKVILTEDVSDLGHRGDVVDVAPGYARNYLVPQAKAVKATTGALKDAEKVRVAREEADARERQAAQAIAEGLSGVRVVVAAQAGDEGKLYGSIGVADIADAVHKFTGIEIDRSIIRLGKPIKEIGLHDVTLAPHRDVEFQLNLDVIPA